MWEETLDQWSPHQGTCLHRHLLRPQPGAMGHSHTARTPSTMQAPWETCKPQSPAWGHLRPNSCRISLCWPGCVLGWEAPRVGWVTGPGTWGHDPF